MLNFPFVDLIIAVIIIWAAVNGVRRGFLKSLLRFASFILSLLLAYFLAGGIISITGNWFGIRAGALAIFDAVFKLVIMIILFVLFEVVFGLIEGHIIRNRISGAEAVGKVLGFSIGFIKAIVIVIVILTLVVFLFPGENLITAQIEKSVVGKFFFETNPLLSIMAYI